MSDNNRNKTLARSRSLHQISRKLATIQQVNRIIIIILTNHTSYFGPQTKKYIYLWKIHIFRTLFVVIVSSRMPLTCRSKVKALMKLIECDVVRFFSSFFTPCFLFLPHAWFTLAEKTLHVPTDDEFLKMYLRPCKYYPKSAFERVSTLPAMLICMFFPDSMCVFAVDPGHCVLCLLLINRGKPNTCRQLNSRLASWRCHITSSQQLNWNDFPLCCSLPQIKTFFKLKQKHSDLYEDLYPNSVIHVYEQELVRLVPTRDQRNGQRILVIHCGSKYILHRTRFDLYPIKKQKQTIKNIFRFICRKMEDRQMLIDWHVPCNSSGNCRVDAWANHTNLRRCCHIGLWRTVAESHHAIHTILCCTCADLGSGMWYHRAKVQI